MDTPLLRLDLDPDGTKTLFEQVYEALRQQVTTGRLAAGDRLPPTRKLAEELGVSRTTVVTAYDQLIAEGFANGRAGSGVYVCEIGEVEHMAKTELVITSSPRIVPPPTEPAPFQPGQPDSHLFPYKQWAKCVARVARTTPEALVKHNDPFGDPELRKQICRYLADWRGLRTTESQVLITAGAIDALELCIRTLSKPSDGVFLEDPGYPPLRTFVENLGVPITYLKTDHQGGLPPAIDKNAKAPSLAVLTPSSQFPLGAALPQIRRNAFLAWAVQTSGWIIEDDYDSEFRYAGRPFQALAGLDTQGRTLYIGSFSKVFSNGLRMGFIVLPSELATIFAASLRKFGPKASSTPQRPLALFMSSGEYYRHIRRIRRIYAERRLAFIQLLEAHFNGLATFEDHQAGMSIAVKLPEELKDTKVAAAAAKNGVSCSALSTYYAFTDPQNGLLMGFCGYTKKEMAEAMDRLHHAITSVSP